MTSLLAAVAVLAAAACLWDSAGTGSAGVGARMRRGRRLVAGWGRRRARGGSGSASDRLLRAGISERVSPRAFVLARGGGAAAGACAALVVAPAVPGRLAPLAAVALVGAGAIVPDALAERAARHRRLRLEAALADAVDLLAVGVAAGRAPVGLLGELAGRTSGPLAEELGRMAAEVECGRPAGASLRRLERRCAAPGISALVASVERSRRLGSPLSAQLHEQAASLRRAERRRIEERAARAAPKIQLVVALVLVPSALLAIAAALIAHSDALLSGP